jgi:hypothetical protein
MLEPILPLRASRGAEKLAAAILERAKRAAAGEAKPESAPAPTEAAKAA